MEINITIIPLTETNPVSQITLIEMTALWKLNPKTKLSTKLTLEVLLVTLPLKSSIQELTQLSAKKSLPQTGR